MNYILHILLRLVVVIHVGLAAQQHGYDLKLDQVFRTPKDYSKVNFDHFEIVERNNFEDAAAPSTTNANDVGPNTIDHPPKSVANAQVMLRFGGDNIRDCHGIPITMSHRSNIDERPYSLEGGRPLYPRYISQPSAPIVHPGHREYRYPPYHQYLPQQPIAPQCIFPYPPPPPYDFPGYYYGLPQAVPTCIANSYSLYNRQLIPSGQVNGYENVIANKTPSEERASSEAFLENEKPPKVEEYAENLPQIQEEADLSVEKLQNVNTTDVKNTEKLDTNQKDQQPEPHQEIVEETVISPLKADVESTSNVDATIADPNPDSTILPCTEETPKESCDEACDIEPLPKENIETLLDQSLIPLSCQKCQEKRKLLVTYPVAGADTKISTIPEDEINVPKCPCCEQHGTCSCCNRERNNSIPYGQRFSKDVDSLLEVALPGTNWPTQYVPPFLYTLTPHEMLSKANPRLHGAHYPHFQTSDVSTVPYSYRELKITPSLPEPVVQAPTAPILNHVPRIPTVLPYQPALPTTRLINHLISISPSVYEGYKRTSDAFFSSGASHSQHPQAYINALQTSSGSGYYSDPVQSIIYREPTITNIVHVANDPAPLVKETRVVEPHLYKVIPRDDISPVNVPELVPTNRYICTKCHNVRQPSRAVCHREYLPMGGNVPMVRPIPYVPVFPMIRHVPMVTNYVCRGLCPTCAKYTGELNELSSRD